MLKSVSVNIIGSLIYALFQWLLLSQIVKKWGVAAGGEYAFAIALLTPIFTLGYIGLRTQLARDHEYKESAKYFLIIRVTVIILLGFLGGILLLLPGLKAYQNSFIALVFMVKAMEGLSDIAYGVNQRSHGLQRQGYSMILRSILGMAGFSIGIYYGSVLLSILLIVVTWIFVFTCFDYKGIVQDSMKERPSSSDNKFSRLKIIVLANFPMVASSALGAYVFNLPRYALEYTYGSVQLGYFSVITSFSIAFNIGVAMLGQAMVPYLAKFYGVGDWKSLVEYAFKALFFIFFTSAIFVLFVWVYGDLMLHFFFGEDLIDLMDQLVVASGAFTPFYMGGFMSFVALACGLYKHMLLLTLSSGMLLSIISLPVVRAYGVMGAVCLFGILGVLQILVYSVVLHRHYRFRKVCDAI